MRTEYNNSLPHNHFTLVLGNMFKRVGTKVLFNFAFKSAFIQFSLKLNFNLYGNSN